MKDVKEDILKMLKDSGKKYVCSIIEDGSMITAIHCDKDDFHNFLVGIVKNMPTLAEEIINVADEMEDMNAVDDENDTMLN